MQHYTKNYICLKKCQNYIICNLLTVIQMWKNWLYLPVKKKKKKKIKIIFIIIKKYL